MGSTIPRGVPDAFEGKEYKTEHVGLRRIERVWGVEALGGQGNAARVGEGEFGPRHRSRSSWDYRRKGRATRKWEADREFVVLLN